MKDDLIKFLAVILLILALVSFFMLVDYSNQMNKDKTSNSSQITLEIKENNNSENIKTEGNIGLEVKENPENQSNIKETGEVSSNITEDKKWVKKTIQTM